MPALPDQLPGSRTAQTSARRFGRGTPLSAIIKVAGGLGLAGVSLGVGLLMLACAGLDAAMDFSPAVILLGIADLVLTLIAIQISHNDNASSALASLFLAVLCIIGGLLEMAVWLHWPILFNA